MSRVYMLLLACLTLTAVVTSKHISNKEVQPACETCAADGVSQTLTRPKRHLDVLFEKIGGVITTVMEKAHELAEHRRHCRRQFLRTFLSENSATYIGNGEDNTNHITYNIYNRHN